MQFIKQLGKQLGFLVLVGSGMFSALSASAQTSVTINANTEGNIPPNIASRPTRAFEFKKFPVGFFHCPVRGTPEAILNGDTFSIVFSKFERIAPPTKVVSESCNLRFNLNVPVGFKVQPINLLYNGFADVPNGGSADVAVRLVLQGKVTAISKQSFASGFSDTFSKDVAVVSDTINACTKPVNIVVGINSSMIARANNLPATSAGLKTQISIDTIDTSIGTVLFKIKFAFLPCT
ncbi:Protein of unknown function DUF4360 [Nostoc flagelliforme CCNUN1]|uniref:Uncharacterized protein n=1 Tax=Nostoc flagelliforme CCNUN1 TaxID=2038116 RepID=A0A2K8SMI6_9NOSO|nr:DUF4360 domain-containing protein [Nostoc flagelliforme]AUB36649.1 Protein of unknown function DUF4360 [Nostoc flagelliforme CCNUN1]